MLLDLLELFCFFFCLLGVVTLIGCCYDCLKAGFNFELFQFWTEVESLDKIDLIEDNGSAFSFDLDVSLNF